METQQLVKEIDGLPEKARQEIERFLLEVKLRYARQNPLTDEELSRWADPEIFGMYADREELRDSAAYVRKLREQQCGTK